MFKLVSLLFPIIIITCPSVSQTALQKPEPKTTFVAAPPDQVTIKTDQTEYTAQYNETVYGQNRYKFPLTASFENRTGATVYLERCYPHTPYPIYDVVLDNGSGRQESELDGYRTGHVCVGHDKPIIVQPGETRIDKLVIYGPNAWTSDKLITKEELTGQFRLTYRAYFCRELIGCERPDAMQYSNVFTVRLQN
jgi:hypothetical protein